MPRFGAPRFFCPADDFGVVLQNARLSESVIECPKAMFPLGMRGLS